MPDTDDRGERRRQAIAKTAGATVGALGQSALSALHVDPFTSTTAGAVVAASVEDFIGRVLSHRERTRVESVVGLAAGFYKERYEQGDDLRDDDFIHGDPSDFSQAVEGVLIASQREHEHKKLPYLAHMLANLAFMPEVDAVTANWCVRVGSQLSWTQYILLALSAEDETQHERTRISAGRGKTHNLAEWSVWGEFEDLQARHLVASRENLWADATKPPRMLWIPTEGGRLLIDVMSLDLVGDEERDNAYAHLAGAAAPMT